MSKMPHTAVAIVFLCAGPALVFAMGDRNEWQQPDRVVNDLCLKPGTKIADIGCGDGYFAMRLARAVGEPGLVFAVDINAGALNTLKKRAEEQRLTNIVAVVSQPTDTLLQPECADMVFFCDVTHEVPEPLRLPLIKSAASALKPKGVLYLIDYRKSREITCDPYDKLIPRDDLVKLCEDAGLRLDAEFHYLKYQVFLRFQKP